MEIEPEQPRLCPEEEEEPYSIENMPVTISTGNSTVSLPSTILQIASDGITLLVEKPQNEWFSIYTSFSNTNSVGVVGHSLMVFIGDQQMQQEQEESEVLKIINDSPAGSNVQLQNKVFTLSIDFQREGKNVLKEVNDILVNYMGEADEHLSRYDEDEDFEQMISAEDIDQNGNIIDKDALNRASGDQESSEGEDQKEDMPDINQQ